MPQLAENHYGKSGVRLLKVTREGETHHVHEWTVEVSLSGDFARCFLDGDNSGLLATDTMKNTVYAVARGSSAKTMEEFGVELAGFLGERNPQVTEVRIGLEEKMWVRITAGGKKHGSAFLQRGPDVATAAVRQVREGEPEITCGVKGLAILKTAHSAFAGFLRDELTTLPDTEDRLLGTEATIAWVYSAVPAEFAATRRSIMDTLLTTFAQHDSLSVQQTLYAMAEAVLTTEPLVAELTLTLPNRHNLPVDFSRFAAPFNLSNDNTIFVPTDEPSGHIHARVTR